MPIFDLFRLPKREQRDNISSPIRTYSAEQTIRDWLVKGDTGTITEQQALSIPAIDCGVTLVSNTIASLPFHLFNKSVDGSRQRAGPKDTLTKLIEQQANASYLSSSSWLRWVVTRLLIDGRSITFIERNGAGRATNLWPQLLSDLDIKLVRGVPEYKRISDGAIFEAGEVLDFVMRPGVEPYSHRSPIEGYAPSIRLWKAIETYGSALFANGGVSPLIATIEGATPEALSRAREDLAKRIKLDRTEGLPVTTLPGGVTITSLGHDPQKSQMLETKQYLVIEFARMLNLHPAMIQDHSKSTFSNTEQADLNYSKHTVTPICHLIESEMNIKLFSDKNRSSFVEFNLDGLQRGDLASRYTAYGQGVTHGFLTPDEIREKENLPSVGGNAGKLFIQSATVALDAQIGLGATE